MIKKEVKNSVDAALERVQDVNEKESLQKYLEDRLMVIGKKDAEIETLSFEVGKKDAEILTLRAKLHTATLEITELRTREQELRKELTSTAEILQLKVRFPVMFESFGCRYWLCMWDSAQKLGLCLT